jgi:lipoprotein-releasing system permease protein
MKLSLFIASRYLIAKKSIKAINIISGISVIGVLVSSASLIAILSFYNGLENLILSMYSQVSTSLKIEPAQGKTFIPSEALRNLQSHPQVRSYAEVLEEKVLIRYDDKQFIGQLKGVDSLYFEQWRGDSLLFHGDFVLRDAGQSYAVLGAKLDAHLGFSLEHQEYYLQVFAPKKGVSPGAAPQDQFNERRITASGVMASHPEIDELMIVPLPFAREVLGEEERITSVEINTHDPEQIKNLQKEWQALLGPELLVKDREAQNPTLYKIIRSEKWAIFAIISFTGLIAILNIVASLTMLVIEKKKDIVILKGLGASEKLIQQIFFFEGMMIALLGCLAGLVVGYLLCWSQITFGWLKFSQADQLIVETYPVEMRWSDFALVFFTILLVSSLVSAIASRLSLRQSARLS